MEIRASKRISSIKPYYFADLEKEIKSLKQSGMDIIRLDMGSPDLPPDNHIIDSLIESARLHDMHGYGESGGSQSLRSAFSTYYQQRFDVQLDPKTEVLGLIGSKEGLFNLSQILIDPGDLVLIPDPSYPVYTVSAKIAGAEVHSMPLLAENDFLPDFDSIPENLLARTKLMWLNYPNNPTGAIAPIEFFEQAIAIAKKYHFVIAHDAPYMDVCFDDFKARSILEVNGAKDVVIEFNSLSKTYNMAGWRVGVAVGNSELVRLLGLYKSQMDTSLFKPIMKAAETALLEDQSWIADRNHIYQQRRDIVVKVLLELGFSLEIPAASLYVWAKLPKDFKDSMDFCNKLLQDTGVSMTPGEVYGATGFGYVRISLVTPGERIKLAMHQLVDWMKEKN